MSSLKQCLKLAKTAIDSNDPETALEYANDALDYENNNIFAYLFQGKSYQLLEQYDKAAQSFKKATKLEPDNLLAWKGYFQMAKSTKDYQLFFDVLTKYVKRLVDQDQSVAETLKDVRNYLSTHKYKSSTPLHLTYLKHVIPGSELYDLIGNGLGTAEQNLKTLIDISMKQEDEAINKLAFRERLKLPKVLTQEQKAQLNSVLWPSYKKSSISQYFDSFLNVCDNDKLRVEYQERYLKYKYELLKVAPNKKKYLNDVKDMVDSLILINIPSFFVWNLYFNLLDISSYNELEVDKLTFFVKTFPSEGLGVLLYGFIHSEISPFESAKIVDNLQLSEAATPEQSDDDQDSDLLHEMEDTDSVPTTTLTPEQVLAYMKQGFETCSDNMLANRIIIDYYIHLREFVECATICRKAIKNLSDAQKDIGADFVHTKEEFICSLAVIYTLHEAPKNFSKALGLYDRVLETNKTNNRARIGRGLILIEKGDLEAAKSTLKQVVEENENDVDALMEYGWCEIQLGNHAEGRKWLNKVLSIVKGLDLRSGELRATARWRLAQSFINENEESANINEAYKHLIESLKDSKTHAPSYTTLGIIYHEYYDEPAKAQKCFYKAFELDIGEVKSARYLVQHLADKNEWEIAEILCTRVVDNEKSRRSLTKEDDKSWPYRVLGCSALNRQDDGKAVEWFQTALRMAAMDLECWVGLGEAYYNSGRLDAAQKVFQRALTMDENSWVIIYMLGKTICDTREYEEGIQWLNKALELKPNEECILNALFSAKLDYGVKLMDSGFFGRVMQTNLETIELIRDAWKVNMRSQSLWLALNQSLKVFLKIQDNLEKFPIDNLIEIFQSFKDLDGYNDPFLDEVDQLEKVTVQYAIDKFNEQKYIESISAFIILSSKIAVHVLPNQGRYIRSVNYFNLGVAFYEGFNHLEEVSYRAVAIKCLKKAIQLEAKNPKFWVALGNAYASFNPQISQHCFIKAIAIESKDGDIWNNLAVLYLKYGDTELAQNAFLRAQSVAPEQSQSWLGNALTAKANDDKAQASNLFTHAFILANGRSPLAQLLYALSVVSKRIEDSSSDPRNIEAAQEFSVANFAIQNYLKFYPKDILGLKIALTISERCKSFNLSVEVGERLCGLLEAKYEETETQAVLEDFVLAKSQLARVYLANEQYDRAIEESLFAIDVVGPENELEESGAEKLKKVILSCRVTIGLSYFFKNELESSLQQLRMILSQYNHSKRLVTLTAQILNAFGTEDTKQAALDQLFTFIEENGSSLVVVLTLGAMSLADSLADYFPAITEELSQLSLEEITQDSFKAVPRLLEEINKLEGAKQTKVWQKNAILFPQDYHVWKHINDRMALSVAQLEENKLAASDMSSAYIKNGSFRQLQRGVVLYPTNGEGWAKLQYMASQTS